MLLIRTQLQSCRWRDSFRSIDSIICCPSTSRPRSEWLGRAVVPLHPLHCLLVSRRVLNTVLLSFKPQLGSCVIWIKDCFCVNVVVDFRANSVVHDSKLFTAGDSALEAVQSGTDVDVKRVPYAIVRPHHRHHVRRILTTNPISAWSRILRVDFPILVEFMMDTSYLTMRYCSTRDANVRLQTSSTDTT